MKKTILIASLCLAALSTSAQTKVPPLDTTICQDLISINKSAIQLISKSNSPANEADVVRQQLQAAIQYLQAKKDEFIAELKKAKEVPKQDKPKN